MIKCNTESNIRIIFVIEFLDINNWEKYINYEI